MANKPVIYDRFGNPMRRGELKKEVAAPTLGGVRSPITSYPGEGLNPVRLAEILRAADRGDPVRYLELAETIEERNPHYLGVLGTRRRSVSQLDITVEPATDSAEDERIAESIRKWLTRKELALELFDILDAIGKGYSFTEVIWETSMSQWRPARLEWRDPRWFRFDRSDLATPMMLDENGQELPLPAFKFIFAQMKAKSGLALRSGLARVAMFNWMFKAYTERDWAIFTQTYGQPLRVGKWGAGASEADKDTLFRAVSEIAGDCAAIIPDSMMIEFIESSNVGASTDHYERRADWLDKQISKAVLGQTATTDAETGGLGSGKEHREVQEDIEKADACALSAIINRDLVRPFVDLEYGPQQDYPVLSIARPEPEDIQALTSALVKVVPLGLRVGTKGLYKRLNIEEPDEKEEILTVSPEKPADANPGDGFKRRRPILKRVEKPLDDLSGNEALQASTALRGALRRTSLDDELADLLDEDAAPIMQAMVEQLELMMSQAGSLAEVREMWLAAYPELDASAFGEVLADAMIAAEAGGRAQVGDG
ncbi:DUF935 domain-containing protein [Roseobacter sp. YSTF-M11]|uniref:DUF935 domain-containing protein n=1 Tax=Roseobacter insulae TaxID=2859783 RepID=A0A9X1JYU4_9RHOB|nr:DUF935 domain-containing protein [Roseobacter insulae]MBW4708631.1 DUF935 domain-containing protein [Roseobacter insulae]